MTTYHIDSSAARHYLLSQSRRGWIIATLVFLVPYTIGLVSDVAERLIKGERMGLMFWSVYITVLVAVPMLTSLFGFLWELIVYRPYVRKASANLSLSVKEDYLCWTTYSPLMGLVRDRKIHFDDVDDYSVLRDRHGTEVLSFSVLLRPQTETVRIPGVLNAEEVRSKLNQLDRHHSRAQPNVQQPDNSG